MPKLWTPKDIENASRASGYDHVSRHGPSYDRKTPKFRAIVYGGKLTKAGMAWQGPKRHTGLQAAQDWCDYMNSNGVTPAPQLKSAGHNGRRSRLPSDPEVEAALGVLRDAKGQAEGKQGYVYCINEEHPGGAMRFVKIGYSTNPAARVAELQTGNPRPLRLQALKRGTVEDEAALHQKYIKQNVLQEWFHPTKELLLEFDLDPSGVPWGSKISA